ncbi:hypothetical protein EJB05_01230, partial [Eragrostis curvula]
MWGSRMLGPHVGDLKRCWSWTGKASVAAAVSRSCSAPETRARCAGSAGFGEQGLGTWRRIIGSSPCTVLCGVDRSRAVMGGEYIMGGEVAAKVEAARAHPATPALGPFRPG